MDAAQKPRGNGDVRRSRKGQQAAGVRYGTSPGRRPPRSKAAARARPNDSSNAHCTSLPALPATRRGAQTLRWENPHLEQRRCVETRLARRCDGAAETVPGRREPETREQMQTDQRACVD